MLTKIVSYIPQGVALGWENGWAFGPSMAATTLEPNGPRKIISYSLKIIPYSLKTVVFSSAPPRAMPACCTPH